MVSNILYIGAITIEWTKYNIVHKRHTCKASYFICKTKKKYADVYYWSWEI